MAEELKVGDVVPLRHGPFRAHWRVKELIDAGALLEWTGEVEFVGHRYHHEAPNGTVLSEDASLSFVGRAHFHTLKRGEHG